MGIRDVGHYRRMMRENPSACVGVSLAAKAIWAAQHPSEDATGVDVSDMHRSLRARYGEALPSATVLRLMATAKPVRR